MKRKIPLVTGEVYHILSRSIAGYEIFNNQGDYVRMQRLLKYYQFDFDWKFSDFINLDIVGKNGFDQSLNIFSVDKEKQVQIIAYCLMPTHVHLILKQLKDDGISKYFGNTLNSYTRHFNNKHKRKGPLWEEKFKNILIVNDNQLLHLTRYIHLNPVTALLANKPEGWLFSSYREYLNIKDQSIMCNYQDILDIQPKSYRKFVNDRISYQKELAKIKALLLD
ncbi:MAG: transposase [Patescibacteria group bacterium]|nr:transposase [Patescibacteria group bacterium]